MHKVGGVTGGTSFDYLQTKFASLTFQATLETYFMQSVSPRGVLMQKVFRIRCTQSPGIQLKDFVAKKHIFPRISWDPRMYLSSVLKTSIIL